MSHTPSFDAKLQALLAATVPGERVCPISGDRWMLTQEEIDRCRAWGVPPSPYAPTMRLKLLAASAAGVDLWWRPHAFTQKPILCSSDPDALASVVTDDEWYALDDGSTHSIDASLDQPFFEQYLALIPQIPMQANYSSASENCIGGGFEKCVNGFMVFGSFTLQDCWYTFRSKSDERCMDVAFVAYSQDSFACCMADRLHGCTQVFDSLDCINSQFLFDARDCENCFCSTNLRRRKYVFMNEQLTQDEYERRMDEIDLSCSSVFEKWKQTFHGLLKSQAVWPETFSINSPECVGDYLLNCLESSGWYMDDARDVRGGWMVFGQSSHSESIVVARSAQDAYMSAGVLGSQNVKFSLVSKDSTSLEYCNNCRDCENCFGCHSLRSKKFHIFNKPYSEEEYWKTVDALKCAMLDRGEYGKWFPPAVSNWRPETGFASVVSPLTAEEIARLGLAPFDPKAAMRFAPVSNQPAGNLGDVPDCINQVGAEWAGIPFDDVEQGRRFNISSREIDYRKDRHYPFPKSHYRGRLVELVRQINGPETESRVCGKCQKMLVVNKNPMFPDRTIYCMDCFYVFIDSRG